VYWSQLGVYGASWLLSFVPYGNFVSDQLYAFYNPTLYAVDSLVTDLIEPVLADPTNPVVWSNGLTAVAYYGANSLLNLGINEVNLAINYFVNWLPAIPLFYVGNLAAPAAATTLVAAAVTPQQPTSVPELVRSALAPVENLVNTAVATLQKNMADTEATIKAAVLPKGVLAKDPATDTLSTEDVVGSTTEPAAVATKAARPRFPAAVKDSVGSAKAGPQTASVGTAKATPGATKADNEPRKSGHAAHAGNSAK
jgi:hypothetical protein